MKKPRNPEKGVLKKKITGHLHGKTPSRSQADGRGKKYYRKLARAGHVISQKTRKHCTPDITCAEGDVDPYAGMGRYEGRWEPKVF